MAVPRRGRGRRRLPACCSTRSPGPKTGAAVGPRESFLVVALIWLLVPVFGALPFLLAGEPQLSSPLDAYFESVSGFTATGATVLTDVEA